MMTFLTAPHGLLKKLYQKHQNFIKFGIIGVFGLVWDTLSVYGLRGFIGLLPATFAAYFIAASMNWLLNRLWTFRHYECPYSLVEQWLRFLTANSCGFFLNRITVASLYFFPFFTHYPVFALACGSVAGLFANFNLSCRVVFQAKEATSSVLNDNVQPANSEQIL